MPLITRRTFPPGGWWYFQPQTQWPKNPQEFFSGKTFEQAVASIVAHRAANLRFGLSTDEDAVASELDVFTCVRLKNDPNYCTGGPSPKAVRPSPGRAVSGLAAGLARSAGAVVEKARKYATGVGVLLDWLGSGGKTVLKEEAERRASVCAVCPKNVQGGIDSVFTRVAADKIKRQLELRSEMELSTTKDNALNICEACLCVLKCKVWVPIEHVEKKLTDDMRSQLDPSCWIKSESNDSAGT